MTRRGWWLRLAGAAALVFFGSITITAFFVSGLEQPWRGITSFCWGVALGVVARRLGHRFQEKYGRKPPKKGEIR